MQSIVYRTDRLLNNELVRGLPGALPFRSIHVQPFPVFEFQCAFTETPLLWVHTLTLSWQVRDAILWALASSLYVLQQVPSSLLLYSPHAVFVCTVMDNFQMQYNTSKNSNYLYSQNQYYSESLNSATV